MRESARGGSRKLMQTIYIRGGKGSNTAIKVMMHHFDELGHKVVRNSEDPFGVGLSWGCSYEGPKPFLNAHVNRFNKYTAFSKFRDAGVACPTTFEINSKLADIKAPFPWLARKKQHSKGKDIVVCKNIAEACDIRREGTHTFFSAYIPIDVEYRVWVFKDKAFATYEKVYKGAGEYQGFMRNRRFGFEFSKRNNLVGNPTIEGPCIKAVKALGMDWGAVDILKGKDGKYYVLEVNSMPHISNIKRSCGVKLAAHVSKWAERQ
jgi:glutathione synthase/RimK-type ligase-like ATP-grasp enzyme